MLGTIIKGAARGGSTLSSLSTSGHMGKVELREPGTYRSRIKAFRNAPASASVLPGQLARIIIDTTVEPLSYQKSSIERATAVFQNTRSEGEIRLEIELPMNDKQLGWQLSCPRSAPAGSSMLRYPR